MVLCISQVKVLRQSAVKSLDLGVLWADSDALSASQENCIEVYRTMMLPLMYSINPCSSSGWWTSNQFTTNWCHTGHRHSNAKPPLTYIWDNHLSNLHPPIQIYNDTWLSKLTVKSRSILIYASAQTRYTKSHQRLSWIRTNIKRQKMRWNKKLWQFYQYLDMSTFGSLPLLDSSLQKISESGLTTKSWKPEMQEASTSQQMQWGWPSWAPLHLLQWPHKLCSKLLTWHWSTCHMRP